MFSYPNKQVDPSEVKPGEEYDGYVSGHKTSYCTVNIGSDGIPKKFNEYPIQDKVDYFFRKMTGREQDIWEKEQTKNLNDQNDRVNLIGIHTDMYDVGDAFHEMWNGWVCGEWREQLLHIRDEDFFIIGIAPAPYGCIAIDNPVAVVAEYHNTGDRFWCHAAEKWIKDMRKESMEEYKKIMEVE